MRGASDPYSFTLRNRLLRQCLGIVFATQKMQARWFGP